MSFSTFIPSQAVARPCAPRWVHATLKQKSDFSVTSARGPQKPDFCLSVMWALGRAPGRASPGGARRKRQVGCPDEVHICKHTIGATGEECVGVCRCFAPTAENARTNSTATTIPSRERLLIGRMRVGVHTHVCSLVHPPIFPHVHLAQCTRMDAENAHTCAERSFSLPVNIPVTCPQ